MSEGRVLSDIQIESYLNERKSVSLSKIKSSKWKQKSGHRQKNIDLDQIDPDYSFQIFERQNTNNFLDFSVGIYLKFTTSNEKIVLMRCNGNSHIHPNKIEKNIIHRKFHVHYATERYMSLGVNKAESFAEETTEYTDIDTAFQYLCRRANIKIGDPANARLDENDWE